MRATQKMTRPRRSHERQFVDGRAFSRGSSNRVAAFLRSVQRKIILIRALESAGVGILIASAVALLLALALLWMGREAGTLCVGAIALGAMVGMAASLLRRVTLLDVACEVDRQLALSDLLATALLQQDAADPWQRAVVAMAEAKCRSLSSADVVMARLGSRAWGGIGLAAALVLAVGAISVSPVDSRARGFDVVDSAVEARESLASSRINRASEPDHDQSSSAKAQAIAPEHIDDLTTGASSANLQNSTAGNQSGDGRSSARTDSASVAPLRSTGNGAPSPDQGNQVAGGGRQTSAAKPGDASDASGTAAGSSPAADHSIAPTPAANADRNANPAASARENALPDHYRDVARRYFGRD